MSDTYVVAKSVKSKTWQISKFSDYKDADSQYTVTERAGHYHCDCPGFYRQKNKDEHKHIQIIKFWRESLEEEQGYALWFDKDESIEYNKFCPDIEEYVKI